MNLPRVIAGFKFDPTDEQLVCYYLWRKVNGVDFPSELVPEADVYAHEPWVLHRGDNPPFMKKNERYFFVKREQASKNGNGKRVRRDLQGDLNGGWWKANTGDKPIKDSQGHLLGYVKTLTFFEYKDEQRSRKQAIKSDWIMHEYRLSSNTFQSWGLCRIKCNKIKKDSKSNSMVQQLFMEAMRTKTGNDQLLQINYKEAPELKDKNEEFTTSIVGRSLEFNIECTKGEDIDEDFWEFLTNVLCD